MKQSPSGRSEMKICCAFGGMNGDTCQKRLYNLLWNRNARFGICDAVYPVGRSTASATLWHWARTKGHWSSRLQGINVRAYRITSEEPKKCRRKKVANIMLLPRWTIWHSNVFYIFFSLFIFFVGRGLLEESEKRNSLLWCVSFNNNFFAPYFELYIFLSLPLARLLYAIRFAIWCCYSFLCILEKHCWNGATAKTIYDSGRIFYRCTYYIGSLPPTLPSSVLIAVVVVVGVADAVPLELLGMPP